MTRRDYVLLATAIANAMSECKAGTIISNDALGVARARDYIADALERDNPRFDRARFIAACTGGSHDPA